LFIFVTQLLLNFFSVMHLRLKDYNEAPQGNNIDRLSALRFSKRTVAMADAGISNKNPIACRAYFKIFIVLSLCLI